MTDPVALVISAAALALALLSYRRDRRASREAAASAERSARRADEAVTAQQRMAQALEDQTPIPEVQWALQRNGGDQYLLSNIGQATAFDITIDLADMGASGNVLDLDQLPARSAHTFMAAQDFDSADDVVTVTWADAPGNAPQRSWSHPLPGT